MMGRLGFCVTVACLGAFFSVTRAAWASGPTSAPAPELAHLPDQIRRDVEAWRERLEQAACLHVVNEVYQTWANLNELDEAGAPIVVYRERYRVHSWMTADMVWMTVFDYDEERGEYDTERPLFQQLWRKHDGLAWERNWLEEDGKYLARRYVCGLEYGPDNPVVAACRGCVYAGEAQSWLAGPHNLTERESVRSIGLFRSPNIAIIPADPTQKGVWLDVFKDAYERDEEPGDPESLYRRRDQMLLARNERGEPEVREWRTIVLTDPEHGGRSPQEITSVRHYTYEFLDAPPDWIEKNGDAFARDIDAAIEEQNQE